MKGVLVFPNIKLSRKNHIIRQEAEIWYYEGFSWETSVVAASLIDKIVKLERRLNKLEGKKSVNSIKKKSNNKRVNVVSIRSKIKLGE